MDMHATFTLLNVQKNNNNFCLATCSDFLENKKWPFVYAVSGNSYSLFLYLTARGGMLFTPFLWMGGLVTLMALPHLLAKEQQCISWFINATDECGT